MLKQIELFIGTTFHVSVTETAGCATRKRAVFCTTHKHKRGPQNSRFSHQSAREAGSSKAVGRGTGGMGGRGAAPVRGSNPPPPPRPSSSSGRAGPAHSCPVSPPLVTETAAGLWNAELALTSNSYRYQNQHDCPFQVSLSP